MTRILYELCGADKASIFSPYSWRVRFALAHKGVETEFRPTPFTAIPALENDSGKTVPLLRDGDHLVQDSFAIAEYLDDTYSDKPLFSDPAARAHCRFIEGWANSILAPQIAGLIILDIHDSLAPVDQEYFRRTREGKMGKTLEDIQAGREGRLQAFSTTLNPLRSMLSHQPFIGGQQPDFADYIVAGSLMWPRMVSGFEIMPEADDPVSQWFERCLDLHNGAARAVKRPQS